MLRLDVSKAANRLGWRCRLAIDEALRWLPAGIGATIAARTPGTFASTRWLAICGESGECDGDSRSRGRWARQWYPADVAGGMRQWQAHGHMNSRNVRSPVPGSSSRRRTRTHAGRFMRAWCQREFAEHGIDFMPLQANMALSKRKGTIRGLHYQVAPALEAKLVRCTRGAVFDVVVDLRPDIADLSVAGTGPA